MGATKVAERADVSVRVETRLLGAAWLVSYRARGRAKGRCGWVPKSQVTRASSVRLLCGFGRVQRAEAHDTTCLLHDKTITPKHFAAMHLASTTSPQQARQPPAGGQSG